MGLIGKILDFTHTIFNKTPVLDIKTNLNGREVVTAQNFSPAGDDSSPLVADYNILVPTGQTGTFVCVGFVDAKNEGISAPGEKRIYARNEAGDIVAELHLKNDETVELSNALGSFKLLADGSFNINGVTIAPNGAIVSPTSIAAPSVVAAGKELAGHLHPAGTPPNNTGANI